jgi:hypothetical protein
MNYLKDICLILALKQADFKFGLIWMDKFIRYILVSKLNGYVS